MWQELDYYQDFQASYTVDATVFHKLIEKERVYDFLAGLNDVFDQIGIQVLGRDPFPSLRQAYIYVLQEESRRNAMLLAISNERAGMLVDLSTITTKLDVARNESMKELEQDNRKCDYCGKSRHTTDTYWKLHGRPTRSRGGKRFGGTRPQAHV